MVDGDAKRGGKRLDFNMLVAVVNNSLIAYDQARDLASVIDAAIRANNDRGGEGDGDGGGRRRSTDSDGGLLNDSEIHVEMEECNRCARRSLRCSRRLRVYGFARCGGLRPVRAPRRGVCLAHVAREGDLLAVGCLFTRAFHIEACRTQCARRSDRAGACAVHASAGLSGFPSL